MGAQPSIYQPSCRAGHQAVLVGRNVYVWAGLIDLMSSHYHGSLEKRRYLSKVDVFNAESEGWVRHGRLTSESPLQGVSGYACAAVGDTLYYFGGWCGHDNCFYSCIHSLSTLSLNWVLISPDTSQFGVPMRKGSGGMVAFKDDKEDVLFIVGGLGPAPSYHQHGAQYETVVGDQVVSNEQHMFSVSTREWSSPNVTGQPPPPCAEFTLTPVDERRAALFGGRSDSMAPSDGLFIAELTKDTVHWTKIYRSMEWPERRCAHAAATCGSLLVMMGGHNGQNTISDCWICQLTTKQWKKLPLPDCVTGRVYHSLSAIQLSPHNVLLVVFGGQRSLVSTFRLSYTVLIELVQEEDHQWVVGKMVERASVSERQTMAQS